jgi:hypothetical protein
MYIRALFCRSGEQYTNWLLKQGKIDPEEDPPEYLSYDQAVEAYNLYKSTEKAVLSGYLKGPKNGITLQMSIFHYSDMAFGQLQPQFF